MHSLRASVRTVAVIGVLMVTGTLAACAPGGESSTLAMRPATTSTEGDSALLTGVLRHEDGCTFVDSAAGEAVVPVFAEDTAAWSGGTLTFSGALSATDKAVAGDTVNLAGGQAQGIAQDWKIPDGCRAYGSFWIVSGG
ncbi:hypothetical protein [Arthrobacter sp. lap29]|uniref:hypothetical protein n=1 Tax=Arthrobacter sp. lap29 TaxID=3056122 RepID=UPI0028F70EEA|nr:hypothetical protein [Arthrobacter sp. lap29]